MANTLNLGDGNWGVKDSSLLGYAKDNTKFVPETFDVTRASSGTRVNKDGFIDTPTEIVSGELAINGDFATDSDWTKGSGWSISGGTANFNGGSDSNIYQTVASFNTSNTYKVQISVSGMTNGILSVRLGGGAGDEVGEISENGSYVFNGIPSSTLLTFRAKSSFIGSIDNVSVVEINQDNLARIDYSDGVDGVLLTEPQSTNLRQLSNTYVGDITIRGTINNDATQLSPSGLLGVEYLTATSTNGLVLDSSTLTGDGTFSVYLKRKTGVGDIRMSIDGAITNTTMAVTNEWKRFSLSSTTGLGQLVVSCLTSGDEVYIWGWQEEALPYATSYIPTYGAIASRSGDLVANAGDVNNFNSEQGVLYAEIAALSNATQDNRYITISNGSSTNRIILRYQGSGIGFYIIANGTGALSGFYAITDTTQTIKVALRWNTNDVAMFVDGTKRVQENTFTTYSPNTLDRLNMASVNGGTFPFYGKTKNIQVFNEALSDAELQTLTTI